MKTIKKLSIALFTVAISIVTFESKAQTISKEDATANPVEIPKIEAGRTLTDADIGFLNAVLADKNSQSRGENNVVSIDENTFEVGHKVTAEEAAIIDTAISKSKNAKKVKNKDKSRGGCNLWCYYYLKDSYGNWYYYYYCCG